MHHNFRVGDIVRLSTGNSPQEVTRIGGDSIQTKYLSSHHYPTTPKWVKADRFVRFNSEETSTMLHTLKSDPTVFGTTLATNSAGFRVFEVRGTGAILLVSPEDLEEVRPHTIETNRGSYQTPPGLFKVGDVLTANGQLVLVTKIDSRSDTSHTLPPNTRRVVTEEVAV